MLNILCFGLHMESFLHPVKKRKVKPRQSKRSKKPLKKLNKPKVKSTCLPSKKKKKNASVQQQRGRTVLVWPPKQPKTKKKHTTCIIHAETLVQIKVLLCSCCLFKGLSMFVFAYRYNSNSNSTCKRNIKTPITTTTTLFKKTFNNATWRPCQQKTKNKGYLE